MKLVAATNNQHKLREFREILTPMGYEIISLSDLHLDIEPEETGETFEENSKIKATAICEATGLACLADDSGIEVAALHNAPGVHSARFVPGSDADRTNKLLELMEGKTDRRARYVSVVTIVFPDGRVLSARGESEGVLTHEWIGENGFGYDPIFYTEVFHKTYGQLTPEEKNSISHRGRALKKLKSLLEMEENRHV